MTKDDRPAGSTQPAGGSAASGAAPPGERVVSADPTEANAPAEAEQPATGEPEAPPAEVLEGDLVQGEPAAEDDGETVESVRGELEAELKAARAEAEERTGDLQRLAAEYANYRKRVERDRALVVEQATSNVLATLLPVLDDLDRAREHGDLVGPFGAVAEQLVVALTKFGLTPFGAIGDVFDPTRHEAVTHRTSADVTEPTCVEVMRRGYQLGDRVLRAALVAVADPE